MGEVAAAQDILWVSYDILIEGADSGIRTGAKGANRKLPTPQRLGLEAPILNCEGSIQ